MEAQHAAQAERDTTPAEARERLVSVIVPTRDRPDFLREALASIRALDADDLRFEILVGDNGADPRTRAVADEFAAIYIPVSKAGAGAARNAGLRAAQGAFIAFLDDDDVWTKEHVRGHLALFDANPELDAVFGRVTNVDEALVPRDTWPEAPGEGDELVRNMLSGYYPQIGATIIRAQARDLIGLFDESLLGDQDWEWQLRLARRRRVGFTPNPSVLFRQRPSGSYDRLRLKRIGFGRRVFLRHALPEYRLWRSPFAMMRAYKGVMWQYYQYFYEAAAARAEAGAAKAEVLRAIWGAARTFPLRAARDLVASGPLQRALRLSLFGRR